MKKQKGQLGFAGLILIELLAAMTVIALLASQTGVSLVKVQAAQNFAAAKTRILLVSQSIQAEQICLAAPNNSCTPSVALLNQIPAFGTISQSGYNFTRSDLGGGNWSYTAVPFADGQSGMGSIYVDQNSVLRCQPVNTGVANAGSPTCQ